MSKLFSVRIRVTHVLPLRADDSAQAERIAVAAVESDRSHYASQIAIEVLEVTDITQYENNNRK